MYFLRIIIPVYLIFLTACSKHELKSELLPNQKRSGSVYQTVGHTSEAISKSNAKSLVKLAKQFVGTRYKAGGKTPSGFDCSGFAYFLFKRFDVYLPSSSSEMAKIGTKVKLKKARPGDLIFFKGENKNDRHAGHVGIVVSSPGNLIKFIHSSTSKGICYDYLETNPYFYNRYMFVKRL
jgi:cell wall-associated NlpC family hydrolase